MILLAFALLAEPSVAGLPDPHDHLVDVHALPWSAELAGNVVFSPLDTAWSFSGEGAACCSGWVACTTRVSTDSGTVDRLRFARIREGLASEPVELSGLPLPHRPITGLVWVWDRYLVFDRWSTPHYGIHYVVDAEERTLLLAAPFADSLYLDRQRPVEDL